MLKMMKVCSSKLETQCGMKEIGCTPSPKPLTLQLILWFVFVILILL